MENTNSIGIRQLARNALVGAALGLGLVGSAGADVFTFTDRAAWEAALSGDFELHEETFDGDAVTYARLSTGNVIGDLSLDRVGRGEVGGIGLTGTGFFEGEVDNSDLVTSDGQDLRFHTGPSVGFGLLGLQNDSATSPGRLTLSEIGIIIGSAQFLLSDVLGLTDPAATTIVRPARSTAAVPFIGFISDSPIDNFVFTHGDSIRNVSGSSEEFYLDGIVVARQVAAVTVPEPGSAPLALLGLALIVAGRRAFKGRRQG